MGIMGKLDENGLSGVYSIAGIILNATGLLALSTFFSHLLNFSDVYLILILSLVMINLIFILTYSIYLYIKDYFLSLFGLDQVLLRNRLIFRNMHLFLLLIWTTLIIGWMTSLLNSDIHLSTYMYHYDSTFMKEDVDLFILSSGFLLWALVTPKVLRAPTNWVLQSWGHNITNNLKDGDLVHFEIVVILNVIFCFFFTFMALLIQITKHLNLSKIDFLVLVFISIVTTLLFAFVPNAQRSVIIDIYELYRR